MSGDERTGGEWDVRECVAPETAAPAPIVGQSAVFPPRSAEDAGATHPLVLLARNPAAAVESRTPAQMRELYLTVDACLEAFVRSDDAAGDAPGAAAQHACCFLLQCAAFLSLHALRPVAGAAGSAAAQGAVDIAHAKAMADRLLEALEWAGRVGAARAGLEAIHALSVICADKDITQETILSASDKVHSHRTGVPLEHVLVATTPPATCDDAAGAGRGAGVSPQLSRLTRALSSGASGTSRSSSFAKQLPVSSWMQPQRSWQEACRLHLAAADGPRRISRALCELVERGALSIQSLECAVQGIKLVQRCCFGMRDMRGHLARLVRHVAREAGRACPAGGEEATGAKELRDDAAVAIKSAVTQKLIVSVLEMEGGAEEIHFSRNLEVVLLAHLFADEASASPQLISAKSCLFGMALSLLTKMMNRVVADGVPAAQDAAAEQRSSLAMLSRACKHSPSEAGQQEDGDWEWTTVYTAHSRMSVLLSVAGESILKRLLLALTGAFVKAPDAAAGWLAAPAASGALGTMTGALGTMTSGHAAKGAALRGSAALGIAPFQAPLKAAAGGRDSLATAGVATAGVLLKAGTDKPSPDKQVLGSSASPVAQAIKHRPAQAAKVREGDGRGAESKGGDGNQRAVHRLLHDCFFKFAADEMLGPVLVRYLTPGVLDMLVDLLEVCSVPARSKSDSTAGTTSATRAGMRQLMRQLAFAMVDRGYLAEDRGRAVLETVVRRWGVGMPREVLALVSRIALRDASLAVELGGDSTFALLLWDSALHSFDPAAALPAQEPGAASAVPSASSSGAKKGVGGKSARTGGRAVMQMEHARLLVLLFTTLTQERKGKLLVRVVTLFADQVAAHTNTAACEAQLAVLALMHSMMSNFWEASDTLVSSLEAFLRSDAQTSSARKPGAEEGGGSCVEALLHAITMAGETERAERKACSKSSDGSQTEIGEWNLAELNWTAGPLEGEAVRMLLGAGDCMPRLVQATHTLLEQLFSPTPSVTPSASPTALTFKDMTTRASLLQCAYLFHRHLHQALLAPGTPEAASMHAPEDVGHTPSLRFLVDLRTKFSRWACGGGPALEQRELAELTLELAKASLEACSAPSNLAPRAAGTWSVPLVCLDALLALQQRLLADFGQQGQLHASSSASASCAPGCCCVSPVIFSYGGWSGGRGQSALVVALPALIPRW